MGEASHRRFGSGAAPPPSAQRGEIAWPYSLAEIRADGVVHLVGLVLAVAGTVALTVAMPKASVGQTAAVAVYLACLVASVSASAAYNLWPVSRLKWLLRRLDHTAIFMLIAGTYTPFAVGMGTWLLLAFVWSVAVCGAALKILQPGRFDRASILLYLALGWSGIAVTDRIQASFPPLVPWMIAAGGVVYSVGIAFHLWERLKFQNAIWHGFVLTATSLFYVAVWEAVGAG